MAPHISPRNERSQPKKFLPEIALPIKGLLKCDMAKPRKTEKRKIFLQEWMDHWDIKASGLAGIAGCKQPYISNIANGTKKNPSVFILLAISEYYKITINDLFKRPPSQADLAALKNFSPQAQATFLANLQKKA